MCDQCRSLSVPHCAVALYAMVSMRVTLQILYLYLWLRIPCVNEWCDVAGLGCNPSVPVPLSPGISVTRSIAMVWQSLQSHLRATAPHLRPIRGIMVAFAITGYLLYRLPISGESWAVGRAVNLLSMSLPSPPLPLPHNYTEEQKAQSSEFGGCAHGAW